MKIQAHRFGQYLVINMSILVDGDISVNEGDSIADGVEKRLIAEIAFLQAVRSLSLQTSCKIIFL